MPCQTSSEVVVNTVRTPCTYYVPQIFQMRQSNLNHYVVNFHYRGDNNEIMEIAPQLSSSATLAAGSILVEVVERATFNRCSTLSVWRQLNASF
jgi:hypothetical protein